nr:hypothetical protein CFP56_69690 [Quercus suber]
MSSKFWTWSKGDPRAKEAAEALRAGGVVSIPVDCITITGMDHARHVRVRDLSYSNRTTDSIMLQDAAVQSATSLMAAMTDMLRSPHLSAHLSAHQKSDGLLPVHGRPRSHTAPSTPLVEASHIDAVELPASNPLDKPPVSLFSPSTGQKVVSQSGNSSNQAALGRQIERPYSSPQAVTYPLAGLHGKEDGASRYLDLRPTFQASAKTKSRSPQAFKTPEIDKVQSNGSNDLTKGLPVPRISRPSLTVVQKWPSKSPIIPSSTDLSHLDVEQNLPQFTSPLVPGVPPSSEPMQQVDSELALIEQINRMQSTHAAYVKSLKECHEKELESNRLYLEYLEHRCKGPPSTPNGGKTVLGIDTSRAASQNDGAPGAASASTVQSFETSREYPKRASHETYAEVEALKRKLSLCRKAHIECVDIRRERDHFRESWERSDRRNVQLKDTIKKAKTNERALRNAAADLEARLVSANNERTDVLEGFHQACRHAELLTEKEHALQHELADLRSRAFNSTGRHASDAKFVQSTEHVESLQQQHFSDSAASVSEHLQKQNQDLKNTLRKAEAEVQQLRQEHQAHLQEWRESQDLQTAKIAELEISLTDQRSMVKAVQAEKAVVMADCARYNSLLRAELRRQGRHTATQAVRDNRTLSGGIDVAAVAAERMQSSKSSWLLGGAKLEDTNAALEKELQYCIQEIILYKLDIKGYKKDLKAVREQLEKRASATLRPSSPDGDFGDHAKTSGNGKEHPYAVSSGGPRTAGLGIAFTQPLLTTARVVTPSAPPATSVSNPESFSPKTRTPLSTHKKLPKPPSSQATSPLTAQAQHVVALHRAETMRSLSESIISSYAKRSPVMPSLDLLPQVAAAPLVKAKSAMNLDGEREVAIAI